MKKQDFFKILFFILSFKMCVIFIKLRLYIKVDPTIPTMPIINHAFLSPRLVIIIPMTLGPMEPPIPYISGSVAFTRPRWEAGVILVIKVLAFIEIRIHL